MCEENNFYRDNICADITIELLCDNVLLDILSYLKARELKHASLVCKRWNEAIGSSAVTMKKFKFVIKKKMLQNRLKNFGSSRKHQNYFISMEDLTDWTVLTYNIELKRVKSFEIGWSRFCELNIYDVTAFLSNLTHLETLILNGMRLDVDGTEESSQLIKMPRLKSAVIFGDYFTILEYIDANELQDLQCSTNCSRSFDDHKSIANSLVRFSNLNRLTLQGCMDVFEHIDLKKINFKLNFIAVYHICVDPVCVNVFAENLRQFLLLQADSLREVIFDFSMNNIADGERIVNDFLQIVFNKCLKLSSLDIRNLSLSQDGACYQSLAPNQSIKNLKVHWNFQGEVVKGLLRNIPRLEKLQAEYCYLGTDDIKNIATLCRNLIYLHTFKLMGIVDDDTLFENLKFLDITKIENGFDPLISLVAKSPMIEQIHIHEYKNSEAFPIDFIVKQPSIQKLIVQDTCYQFATDENNLRIAKKTHTERD